MEMKRETHEYREDRVRSVHGHRWSRSIPRPVLNGSIIACCGAGYALNVWLLDGTAPFFRDYFNDILAGTLLLAYANAISPGGTAVARYVASLPGALSITAFASIVWEGVAPRVLADSTPDIADVAAYFAGAALYLATLRRLGSAPEREGGSRIRSGMTLAEPDIGARAGS
jgi:hypothetical protein